MIKIPVIQNEKKLQSEKYYPLYSLNCSSRSQRCVELLMGNYKYCSLHDANISFWEVLKINLCPFLLFHFIFCWLIFRIWGMLISRLLSRLFFKIWPDIFVSSRKICVKLYAAFWLKSLSRHGLSQLILYPAGMLLFLYASIPFGK